MNDSEADGADPGFRKILTLAELDNYTQVAIHEERGAFVGIALTDNCTMYRDVVGGTRVLQFEDPPMARDHAAIVLKHLPADAVCCDAELDPGGSYYYYRCPGDILV